MINYFFSHSKFFAAAQLKGNVLKANLHFLVILCIFPEVSIFKAQDEL